MATTQYITVAGDRWDTIADKAYGQSNKKQLKKLQSANPYIQYTTVFPAGVKIVVEIEELENTVNDSLTVPWKRLPPNTNAQKTLSGFANGGDSLPSGFDSSFG